MFSAFPVSISAIWMSHDRVGDVSPHAIPRAFAPCFHLKAIASIVIVNFQYVVLVLRAEFRRQRTRDHPVEIHEPQLAPLVLLEAKEHLHPRP